MITLTPRGHVPWQLTFAIPILAVVLTIMAGGVIFAILGFEPLETLYEFFIKPLSQPCLLYTSPSPRDGLLSRMPSSA